MYHKAITILLGTDVFRLYSCLTRVPCSQTFTSKYTLYALVFDSPYTLLSILEIYSSYKTHKYTVVLAVYCNDTFMLVIPLYCIFTSIIDLYYMVLVYTVLFSPITVRYSYIDKGD